MVAVMQGQAARKQKAGRVLLAIGGAALFLQLWALWLEAGAAWGRGAAGAVRWGGAALFLQWWALWLEAGAAWSRGAAEWLGWMGALGMAALQIVDFIAWNPN